jgi:hypothetical protein
MAMPPTSLDDRLFAGHDDVMLPDSGVWLRIRMPTPEQLLRRGLIPQRLLAAALAAGPGASQLKIAKVAEQVSPEEGKAMLDEGQSFTDQVIRLMVRARRADLKSEWESWTPTLEQVAQLQTADHEALAALVERRTTPAMVTAYAKMKHGLLSAEEATAERDRAAGEVVDAWESFRDWTGVSLVGPVRKDVGRPAQLADRNRRSRRRASA